MYRKLTRTGPSSLTIALPADWVKEQQLEPGATVRVERAANGIRISPVAQTERSTITIRYNAVLIHEMLVKIFSEQYTEITIRDPPKPATNLLNHLRTCPGFVVIEQTNERIVIQRTLASIDTNPRAVLLRAFRLVAAGAASNPPKIEAETNQLLYSLTLEQYEPAIVSRLLDLVRTLSSSLPYYDNAYAHVARVIIDCTAQYSSFDQERAERITRYAEEVEHIIERTFSRTEHPLLLAKLLHAARLLEQIHSYMIRNQSAEALQESQVRTAKKTYTIGVCLADKFNAFWAVDVTQGLQQEAKNIPVQLRIDAPIIDSDPRGQQEILEQFLADKVDALILVPIDSRALEKTYKKYCAAHIPVIAIDTDIEIPSVPHYFVGFDNFAGGKMVATYLNKRLPRNGHIVLITGRSNGNSPKRIAGFVEGLRKDCTVHELQADYVASIAYEKLVAYAKKHKIDAVFAVSDNMAQAAIKAIEDLGLTTPVAGFDNIDEGRRSMDEGKQVCDVDTHPRKLGSIAVQLCNALLQGKQVAERTIYDIEFVAASDRKKTK